MSRVENSDDRRMREMNEAKQRLEKDNRTKGNKTRQTQSFNQVMQHQKGADKAKKALTQRAQAQQSEYSAKDILNKLKQNLPQSPQARAKRNAMRHAIHGQQQKKQSLEGQQQRVTEQARGDEMLQKAGLENEHIEAVNRDEEDRDYQVGEERQAEVQQEQQQQALLERVGHHQQRRRGQQGGGGRQNDERQAAAVQGAGPARRARRALPPELIKQMVNAVHQVVKDGRTSLRVALKGPGMEGVELEVHAEKGQISCNFSGCNDKLKQQLKSGGPVLAEALGKRGFKLRRLSFN